MRFGVSRLFGNPVVDKFGACLMAHANQGFSSDYIYQCFLFELNNYLQFKKKTKTEYKKIVLSACSYYFNKKYCIMTKFLLVCYKINNYKNKSYRIQIY